MIAVNPAEILRELGAVGITLTVLEPDRLIARPTERVTPEIKETLRGHKPEIIRALRSAENPEGPPGEPSPEPKLASALTASPRDLARAAQMGLCSMWARGEFGYVSVHDPLTGEWHSLPTKDANFGDAPWMISEAQRRKRLWRAGNRNAYRLNREQMEQRWDEESQQGAVADDPGIVDPHQAKKSVEGLIYEDYLEEEEKEWGAPSEAGELPTLPAYFDFGPGQRREVSPPRYRPLDDKKQFFKGSWRSAWPSDPETEGGN